MKWKLIVNPKPLKAKSPRSSSVEILPVCTLILPSSLFRKFRRTWKGKRSGARCLSTILGLYSSGVENAERLNPDSLLLLYQKKDRRTRTGWNRLNFRPDAWDWQRLGKLAGKHRVSRCYLFSYLLEKYFSGESGPSLVRIRNQAA